MAPATSGTTLGTSANCTCAISAYSTFSASSIIGTINNITTTDNYITSIIITDNNSITNNNVTTIIININSDITTTNNNCTSITTTIKINTTTSMTTNYTTITKIIINTTTAAKSTNGPFDRALKAQWAYWCIAPVGTLVRSTSVTSDMIITNDNVIITIIDINTKISNNSNTTNIITRTNNRPDARTSTYCLWWLYSCTCKVQCYKGWCF